jgi:glycosyltransferase involved in cell wall biosynthesis
MLPQAIAALEQRESDMTSPKPLVSIGLPVYNGEHFIARAIESLLAQDYALIELIISDNASTDRTPEICREYAAKDPRVHYHRNSTNLGVVKNFNRVFELSSGDYFMWAGDHDLRAPTYISRCLEIMVADPSVVLCCSQTVRVAPDGSHSAIIPPRLDTRGLAAVTRFQLVIWSLSYCYQTYGLIRSDALKRTQLFRDTIGPDTVLLTELALLGAFAYIPELLFYMRQMPDAGDWVRYASKLNKHLTPLSASFLYVQMIYNLLVVHEQIHQPLRKIGLMLAVLLCIPIRYRLVLRDMIRSARARRRAPL